MEVASFHDLRFGELKFESLERYTYLLGTKPTNLGSRKCRRKSINFKSRGNLHCSIAICSQKEAVTASMGQKTLYKDSFIEAMAINHLSTCVKKVTGKITELDGYEGLVDVVSKTFQGSSPIRQQELVIKALRLAIPEFLLCSARNLLLPSRFTSELLAAFTPFLFRWLVGPSEVRQTEVNGTYQRSMVHIKKCRLLESTNCVGICTNLCKIPSQQFIGKYLGTPVTLTPNFEDMSCELIFGKQPAPIEEDPVFIQPCYKLCAVKQKHTEKCSNLEGNSV